MEYNCVMVNFWDQVALNEWDSNTIQIAFYILTCKHRTSEGLFYLPLKYIKPALNLQEKEIKSGIKRLAADDFIRWDKDSKVVMITNALKHQPIDKISHKKAAYEHLNNLPRTYLYFDLLKKASIYSPSLKTYLINSMPREFINDILKLKINRSKAKAAEVINEFAEILLCEGAPGDELNADQSAANKVNLEEVNSEKSEEKEEKDAVHKKTEEEVKSRGGNSKDKNDIKNNKDTDLETIDITLQNIIGKLDLLIMGNKKILYTDRIEYISYPEDEKLPENFLRKSKAYQMTLYLIETIRSHNKLIWLPEPKSASSLMKSWVSHMEKLFVVGPIDYDEEDEMGLSWEEIKKIINFSQQDQFWQKEITSPKKLRKHALELKMQI